MLSRSDCGRCGCSEGTVIRNAKDPLFYAGEVGPINTGSVARLYGKGASVDSTKAFILNEYRAQQAQEDRRYALAIHHSKLAAEAAVQGADNWGYCRMTFNIATLQYESGLLEDAVATSRALVHSEAIGQFPDFKSKAKVLLSRALQGKGDMEEALSVALAARALTKDEGSADIRLSAQHGLIAALAEEGDLAAAWVEALNLSQMLGADASPRVAGMAYWTIGNVGFMAGKNQEGLEYHRRASLALSSINDVNQWGLFNKASAHMRLVAGMVETETLECIERAEVALGITGASESEMIELVTTRARWELETGNPAKAESLLRSASSDAEQLYPFLHAGALQLMAQCLHAMGRRDEALNTARESEKIFREVGAGVRAAESQELVEKLQMQD